MIEKPTSAEETDSDSFNLLSNEKMLIDKALKKFGWNMSKTARELGINRSTLYEKIKKHEL
jgi:transcriptional regulator of acetoin/glycerol metabolism